MNYLINHTKSVLFLVLVLWVGSVIFVYFNSKRNAAAKTELIKKTELEREAQRLSLSTDSIIDKGTSRKLRIIP